MLNKYHRKKKEPTLSVEAAGLAAAGEAPPRVLIRDFGATMGVG